MTPREQIDRLLHDLVLKDAEFGKRATLTAELAARVAIDLGVDPGAIEIASLLHDIWMQDVAEEIVHKPGPLTAEETRLMRRHVTNGRLAMSGARSEAVRMASDIAWTHHENWDGTGYPRGISGEDIPLPARIVTVVGAFVAMTTDRPFRKALPRETAIDELERYRGTQFDPSVVDAFLRLEL